MKSSLILFFCIFVLAAAVSAQDEIEEEDEVVEAVQPTNRLQRFRARHCLNRPICGAGNKFQAFVFDSDDTCPTDLIQSSGIRQKVCRNVSISVK
jgi:hypothetical protein